jgi:uncharacterized protein
VIVLARGQIPRQVAAMTTEALSTLSKENYINMITYKRDGSGVETPVWFAMVDQSLVVFTLNDSYKVKRLGRNEKVKVAACNVRGKVHGLWVEGHGHLVTDSAEEEQAYAALVEKYGWQMRIGNVLSKISGRMKKRVVIKIHLDS